MLQSQPTNMSARKFKPARKYKAVVQHEIDLDEVLELRDCDGLTVWEPTHGEIKHLRDEWMRGLVQKARSHEVPCKPVKPVRKATMKSNCDVNTMASKSTDSMTLTRSIQTTEKYEDAFPSKRYHGQTFIRISSKKPEAGNDPSQVIS